MRISEFWIAVESEFGSVLGDALTHDQVLPGFDGLTSVQALDAGYSTREVWLALCQVQDVPEGRRLGPDFAE